MGFQHSLGARARPPLMFEPVPPPKKSRRAEIEAHLDGLADAIDRLPRVEGVNIPQIIGGAYETVDALAFAVEVQERTGCEALVNKIVALTPEPELTQWVGAAQEAGIRHIILVGGESSKIDYPGPSVTQADRLVSACLEGEGTIGNICIPFRRRPGRDEPDRMVAKTQAGADHFTSQIVLEPVTTRRLLRDYERACRLAGVRPATIFIGLAPVTDAKDIQLLRHLGVEVPPHVERDLLWEPDKVGERSLELNLGILRQILETTRNENIQVPLGLNVEQVSLRNWEASIELAQEATLLLEEHSWLVEADEEKATAQMAS